MTFLNLSINSFFIDFLYPFLNNFFFIDIKISKNLSVKYYQENKKRQRKSSDK